ncbi:MAG: hypothetical protein ACPG7S_03290, partial [Miltoncostaeaceae bacterium]
IMGLLPYPDQDRSVKAHRAANPVPAAAPEGAPADASAEAPATDAPEVEATEVVEEPVAVGAGDAEERAE